MTIQKIEQGGPWSMHSCETQVVMLHEVVWMSEKRAFVNLESLHTAQGRR